MAKRFEYTMPDQYLFSITIIEASRGNREEAKRNKKSLDEYMQKFNPTQNYDIWDAAYYAVLGEKEKAIASLTKFYEANPFGHLIPFFCWHFFDRYRSNPEFIALFEKAESHF